MPQRLAERLEILRADHVGQILPLDVFGMAAGQQSLGADIGLAAELRDPRGNQIRVPLLIIRVLEKLLGGRLRVNALAMK